MAELTLPFEAVGVQDFNTVPIVTGQEYIVTAISADGTRWQTTAPDGVPGWFPAKYCIPISGTLPMSPRSSAASARPSAAPASARPSVQAQPQYAQPAAAQPQAQLQRATTMGDEQRRREKDEQRRQEEERKRLLRGKVEQRSLTQQPMLQDEEEDELPLEPEYEPEPAAKSSAPLQTFASSKGYLASVPGFDADLVTYTGSVRSRQGPPQPPPEPEPVVEDPPEPQASPRSGLYQKTGPADPNRDWRPNPSELPAQYQGGGDGGPTGWRCPSCGTVQKDGVGKCGMCGTGRTANAEIVYLDDDIGDRPFSADWKCSRCAVSNDKSGLKCKMCGNDRPKSDPAAQRKQSLVPKSSVQMKGMPGVKPKKKIVSKAASGVELEYAKKVDVYTYKTGTTAIAKHGASY